ncbi:hypothetical protein V1L52_04195 [Treponema sp. HNW]|uniref:hypothetical protein n=1 Tax=Treponema sp. HNW TaxID=3116654 RepID=UPI003D110E63
MIYSKQRQGLEGCASVLAKMLAQYTKVRQVPHLCTGSPEKPGSAAKQNVSFYARTRSTEKLYIFLSLSRAQDVR